MATVTGTKRHLGITSNTYDSNGDVVVGGNLTVEGTTTTLDTANLLVEDKNIIIGNVSTPSDTTADGGGITLKGASDYTINWVNANNRWEFNQGIYSSGPITSAGQITGTELEGTSLDINGNADISGNLSGVDTLTATTLSVTNYGLVSGDIPNNAADTTGLASHATNLNATDDRDIAPEDLTYNDDLRIFFAEKSGIEGGTVGSDYQDLLVLNSYADSSGGSANALGFDKNSKRILHYNSAQTATNWGTPKQLAYTDSDITGEAATVASIGNLTGHITSTNRATSLGSFTTAELNAAISDGTINSQTLPSDFVSAANGGTFSGDLFINSSLYVRGANERIYMNGGGATDWRGVEVNSSGLWHWGETGTGNYFSKNIGIGTTTPSNLLSLRGSGQNWSTSPAIKMWDSHNSKGWYVGSANNHATGDFYIRSVTSEAAYPVAANQEFTIKQSGNVGIGTISPNEKLHVEGSGIFGENANGRVIVSDDWMGGELGIMTEDEQTIGVIYPSQNRYSYGGNYGSEPLNIDSNSGNVGIGTTSPSSPLEVYGSGSTVLDIQGSQGQLFSITDNLSGDLFTVSDISGVPIFNVNATGLATVDGDMSIGLNGATPVFTLDVGGDIGTDRYIRHNGDSNTYFGFSGADTIQFNTNSGERLRIDSAGDITFKGDLLIGNTAMDPKDIIISQIGVSTTETTALMHDQNNKVVVRNLGSNAFNSTAIPTDFVSAANGGTFSGNITVNGDITGEDLTSKHTTAPILKLRREDSSIVDGDSIGSILFQGDDPGATNTGAAIKGVAAGTWNMGSPNVYPSELLFQTAKQNTLITALTINEDQNVGIGTTSPASKLQIGLGTGTGSDGIFIKGEFAGGTAIVNSKNPFISLGTSTSAGYTSTIYLGANATATDQDSKIEFNKSNNALSIYYKGQGTYREHVRFGDPGNSTPKSIFFGNVGIGTTSPSTLLHTKTLGANTVPNELRIESRTTSGYGGESNINLYTSTYGNPGIYFGNQAAIASQPANIKYTGSSNLLHIETDGSFQISRSSSIKQVITSNKTYFINNNVGIHSTAPSTELEVGGTTTTENLAYKKPTSDNQFRGEIVTFGSQSGIAQGDIVAYNSSGQWVKAQANSGTTSKNLLGVAMGTIATAGILLRGFVRDASFGNQIPSSGQHLYLSTSTSGDYQTAVPSTAGHIARIIGYSVDPTNEEIYFCPDNTFVEIA